MAMRLNQVKVSVPCHSQILHEDIAFSRATFVNHNTHISKNLLND